MANEQEGEDANRAKAEEWIRTQLEPALQEWARSCLAGAPEDIEKAPTDPTRPLGKTLEWRQQPFPVPRASITFGGVESLTSPEIPAVPQFVCLSYTIRLEVSAEAVIGHIEFAVEGEVKHHRTEPDILKWDKERIRENMMDRMCGES
jgi:hypothetical protein